MIETFLIARDRKSGKDVLIAGREVRYDKQLKLREELAVEGDTFSEVLLINPTNCKKPLRLQTSEEVATRAKQVSELASKQSDESAASSKTKTQKPSKKSTKTNETVQ